MLTFRDIPSVTPQPLKPELLKKSRARRAAGVRGVERAMHVPAPRNDQLPGLQIEQVATDQIKLRSRNVRKISEADVEGLADSIAALGFSVPVLIGRNGYAIDGDLRVLAARKLGLKHLPCVLLTHLSEAEERALRLSSNRIGLERPYDIGELRIELNALVIAEQPIRLLGFSGPELDQILLVDEEEPPATKLTQVDDGPPISKLGDLWQLGEHLLLCGDATDPACYERLLGKERAQLLLTDPPYNVKISGIVSTKHKEFVQGSGEMSEAEFATFLERFLATAHTMLVDGGVALSFMDWEHISELVTAGKTVGYELLNIICWMKQQGGMGSLWRSQHELIAAFKKPGKHKNNIALGKHGRDRTNCWVAPGANSPGSEAREMLDKHPTSKPPALLADAILDVTDAGDIVLDPFGGSGSTLIACERTRRVGRLIELDPSYCDLIMRRWQQVSEAEAIHARTGRSFNDIAQGGPELLETIDA